MMRYSAKRQAGMRIRAAAVLCALLLAAHAQARELKECITLAVKPGGEATLTNVCVNMVNIMYCIDNPASARTCSAPAADVVTLAPAASATIAAYTTDGGGPVRWAVCAYPEAPVGWKADGDGTYACKKTCVMC